MSFFGWLLFLFFKVIFSFHPNYLAFQVLESRFVSVYPNQHSNGIVDLLKETSSRYIIQQNA